MPVQSVLLNGKPAAWLRALVLLGMALCWGGAAQAQALGNTLRTNQSIKTNQYLESTNKTYRATVWPDGNFIIHAVNVNPWREVWSSKSNNARAANGAVLMQGDGNLCLNGPAASGAWCNYSNGAIGSYFAILRDSGDIEVYRGDPANTGAAVLVWTSLLDPVYYSNKYPDLKNAFNGDARRLMDHWITYGRQENRSPKNGISDEGRQRALSVNLDTVFYANKYPDLKNAFGYDAGRLYEHWMNFGMREARMPNRATDELMAAPPRSANGRDVMRLGDWLSAGETMWSANRRFRLDLQSDGQLVIYEGNPSNNSRRWFQSQGSIPVDPQRQYFMVIQPDGHSCTYQGTLAANRGFVGCSPSGAGGPIGRYFLALQDDGNLVVYKGNGPNDNRGWIWDRITTRPSSGFNLRAVAESVTTFVVNTANTVAGGTTAAANTVAGGTVAAANELAREATSVANQVATGTVDVANKVANTTEKVAVTVGRSVEQGGKIVGKEIVRNGEIVGYAVADLAVDAWNLINANCGVIGRRVFPVDAYFKGTKQVSALVSTYGNADMKKKINEANQCFEQAQDGFYCAFPAELAKIVSQSAQIPGNMINLSTRVFNEAKTQECLIAGASTVTFGAMGLQVCALGKVVVHDAQKAYACFTAAEAKGVMTRFLPAGSTGSGFPSKAACEGIGELAFSVAEKVVTNGLSTEAKAATAAGKSRTLAIVADQLLTVYKIAGSTSTYNNLVGELDTMPECRD